MAGKHTFLFAPVDAVGHCTACIGIASALHDRGHSIVFAVTSTWKGKLAALGFREEFYEVAKDEIIEDSPGAIWGEMIAKLAPVFSLPSIELVENYYLEVWSECFKRVKYYSPRMSEIINTVKPDVIIADNVFHVPAIMDSGTPWVQCISLTPLPNSKDNVPPAYSGYPTVSADKSSWKLYDDKVKDVFKHFVTDYNKWIVDNGGREVKLQFPFFQEFSPYANVYMYPKELDYTPFRPNPPKFHQFDSFLKIPEDVFQLPEKLKNGPGKLIYFSMGTMGCIEVRLMRRLIGILSKSPHRFIVSKGGLGDGIELGENMWGANSVPQTSVIPLVDLVITHGGNNTVTETFYFGKRLLVLPLVFDQLDNAQRIYETGLGLQFHPYKVTEVELLQGIETILGDDLLERRMISISQRIQAAKPQQKVADLMEKVASEAKSQRG